MCGFECGFFVPLFFTAVGSLDKCARSVYHLSHEPFCIAADFLFYRQVKVLKKITELFLTFLKIGAFTFGGGYAMIALLENELVSKKNWITKDEFLDMTAIAESTPGPVAVNAATYIGFRLSGFWGAAAATLAVCLPSFAVIYIISLFLDKFMSLEYVGYAFRGIQVCVVYLILSAGIKMMKALEKNALNIAVAVTVGVLTIVFSLFAVNFSSVYFILISGFAAAVLFLIKRKKSGGTVKK